MNNILIPPEIVEVNEPIIFLAGPIQGAQDWQEEAIKIIHSLNPNIIIASPRREYLEGDFVYEKQVDWETYYLRKAGKSGAIIFWMAKEFEHRHDRAYAQTSRFELAEWKVKHEWDGANIVVGVDNGFTGARYIKRRMAQDCPDLSVFDSLEATCKEAVALWEKAKNK